MEKTVVCFANSRKKGERCFAGKSIDDKQWIRPVSNRETHALNDIEECLSGNNCECSVCNPLVPNLLDIVMIDVLNNESVRHQHENYLLGQERWEKIGILNPTEIDAYIERNHKTIWHNGFSTYNRINDRVPISLTKDINNSLMLIEVDDIEIDLYDEETLYGSRRRINGIFKYKGASYILPITDSFYEDYFRNKEPKVYKNGRKDLRIILCISLGEDFKDYCYKLIAGIIRI